MEKEIMLSDRLTALVDMVTPGMRVCDVGCDHGFLAVYLVQKKISPYVIAMDLRTGPLSRAAAHIRDFGLDNYIETRISDGLTALHMGEAQSVICAGMGGRLMQRILEEGHDKAAGMKELILQPQSELAKFRIFLRDKGYQVVAENMIEEDGKFYPIMKVVHGEEGVYSHDPLFDRFGMLLLTGQHPVLKRFLAVREENLLGILEQLAGNTGEQAEFRRKEIEEELSAVKKAADFFF